MSTKFQDVAQQSKLLIQRGVNRKEGSILSARSISDFQRLTIQEVINLGQVGQT